MSIDLVISFDTTGSMFPALTEVRRKVDELIKTLFDTIPNLRIGLIAHGDYIDGQNMIKSIDLTDDRFILSHFVRTVKPTNGGDSAEAYEAVLNYVLKHFEWRSNKRALILIGDDIPHTIGYQYGAMAPVSIDWQKVATQLVTDAGVNIYPVQALNRSHATYFYELLASISNTVKLDLYQFSDVVQLITALVYKQTDDYKVVEYRNSLESSGKLNRNLREIFNKLLNERTPEILDDAKLIRIDPSRFQILYVDYDTDIKSFVESTGATFRVGRGFYQLTKSVLVQEHKEVVLYDPVYGIFFTGDKARELINLPYGERGTVTPDQIKDLPYIVFVQSTSNNRKLLAGTKFLYEAK
jgi:hypothetical protein